MLDNKTMHSSGGRPAILWIINRHNRPMVNVMRHYVLRCLTQIHSQPTAST